MPFFENAKQFAINGGNFIDVKGNQNNYNYDQSLHVSGQNNSAVYNRGPYYRAGDSNITNNAQQMTVIGQGSNANIGLGANGIPTNYSPPQSYVPPFGQPYGPSMAQPYGYGGAVPPNGMFNHNSTGHLNPHYPPASPQPQQPHFTNGFPPQPGYNAHPSPPPQPSYNTHPSQQSQPVYQQHPGPAHHYPQHSQSSVQSAPPAVPVPLIQVNQTTHQRDPSHTSATPQLPNMVPLPPSPQPTSPPLTDHQATAQGNAHLNTTVPMSTPSAASSTGSISGTTLAQSPQPSTTRPVFPNPAPTASASSSTNTTPTSASTIAPSAMEASTSSTSAPATATTQPEGSSASVSHPLTEFSDLVLKPGATFTSLDDGKKKKKKKKNIFSRMFGKKSKDTPLAVKV